MGKDISQMTDEEQLEEAMRLSMMPASSALDGNRASNSPAQDAGSDRARPRSFPRKDGQDVLPQLARGTKKQRGEPRSADSAGEELKISEGQAKDLFKAIFGDGPEVPDVQRWLDVGFQFSPRSGTEYGLWQRQGGPCGVFAPVQGFIVKNLLFGGPGAEVAEPEGARKAKPLAVAQGEEDQRTALLAYALASILYQSTPTSSYVICQVVPHLAGSEAASGKLPAAGSPEAATAATVAATAVCAGKNLAISARCVKRASDALGLLEEGVDTWLAGPCGVLSFLCSVLLSRTLDTLREDMDVDENTKPLIGRFGHCSQELVNLMLIGESTSNVFDGSRWLADDPSMGCLCKGVDGDRVGTPTVGYLSELEPMRYVEVGTLYKHPDCPIWVLGSPNHYTLIFSTCRTDAQLSKEAQLEQKAKKIFNTNALDEGSIAMSANLAPMLQQLGLADRLSQAQSELVQEDIVLWEGFRGWAMRQFGYSADAVPGGAGKKVNLFLYDGQDPPGPSLRQVTVELSDIDPRFAGGSAEGEMFAATLQTRWPNSIVQVQQ